MEVLKKKLDKKSYYVPYNKRKKKYPGDITQPWSLNTNPAGWKYSDASHPYSPTYLRKIKKHHIKKKLLYGLIGIIIICVIGTITYNQYSINNNTNIPRQENSIRSNVLGNENNTLQATNQNGETNTVSNQNKAIKHQLLILQRNLVATHMSYNQQQRVLTYFGKSNYQQRKKFYAKIKISNLFIPVSNWRRNYILHLIN